MAKKKEAVPPVPRAPIEVSPEIWDLGPPKSRLERILGRITRTLAFSSTWTLIVLSPIAVLLSMLGTYYLVGPTYFGPALFGLWAVLIGGFILVMEKSGYARNFEASDFKFSKNRLLATALIFAVLLTVFYLLTFVAKRP
jgi:uncharacterized membrane protein